MNDLEDRVRRALDAPVGHVDADRLLAEVRRGATRRRRRRTVTAIAASVLVVAGVGGLAASLQGDDHAEPQPVRLTHTPSPTDSPSPTQPPLPEGSSQGVIDVSVVPHEVFRLTTNVGCAGCSTVWRQDAGADGGWERLHDFGSEAYAGKSNPRFGPVERLAMTDGIFGWAWGDRIYSTSDGGRTWTEVTDGPGRVPNRFGGHTMGVSHQSATVWSLLRAGRRTELWRAGGAEGWVRADAPDMSGVNDMFTVGDFVALVTYGEGLGNPRLQYANPGYAKPWAEVANPCPGERNFAPATTVAFTLCPAGASSATVYGLYSTESGDLEWHVFGHATGPVTAVVPVSDRKVLLVGDGSGATLMTDGGTRSVDLGLEHGEEIGPSSSDGRRVMIATFGARGNRLLGSTDGGATWHEVP